MKRLLSKELLPIHPGWLISLILPLFSSFFTEPTHMIAAAIVLTLATCGVLYLAYALKQRGFNSTSRSLEAWPFHPGWLVTWVLPLWPFIFLERIPSHSLSGQQEAAIIAVIFAVVGGGLFYLDASARRNGRTPFQERFAKEFRSLLPAWLIALFAASSFVMTEGGGNAIGVVLFCIACALMGASVFGNEFNHRTLPLLLAQPVPRKSLWRIKMQALLAALLSAAILFALAVIGRDVLPQRDFSLAFLLLMLLIPIGCAFCSGPWLTLATRNVIGAVVFSLAIPIIIAMGGSILSTRFSAQETFGAGQVSRFLAIYFAVAFAVYWLLAYWRGYARFKSFEAIESIAHEASAPFQIGVISDRFAERLLPKSQGPFGALVKKELRLQQASYLLAGVFCIVWLAVLGLKWARPGINADYFLPLLFIYISIAAITIGAVSVAEERHLGLHDWHLTLPPSRLKQWLIKIVVNFACSLVLAVLLPVALLGAAQLQFDALHDFSSIPLFIVIVFPLTVTAIAIYASSISDNTLRAVLGGLGLCVAIWASPVALFPVCTGLFDFNEAAFSKGLLPDNLMTLEWQRIFYFGASLTVGTMILLAIILSLAYANFRFAGRSPRQLWGHALWFFLPLSLLVTLLVNLLQYWSA